MSAAKKLAGNQLAAVSPDDTVWLNASAGTGKTHVLTSRVLRLLLQPDVSPAQIMCLTFTKAGAAEMASRISERLASWVRMDEIILHEELEALGADSGPQACARARTLFAAVLDCPGGGLRIDTIHAFAQWLLGTFPVEANLTPGTRAMEDRERTLLARRVLADLLTAPQGDSGGVESMADALAAISLRMQPEQVEAFLLRCAEVPDLWTDQRGWQGPLKAHINRLLGLAEQADVSDLAVLCSDDVFDLPALKRCLAAQQAWGTPTGSKNVAAIADWQALSPDGRLTTINDLKGALFNKKNGEPSNLKSLLKQDPDYEDAVRTLAVSIDRIADFVARFALADRMLPALELGRAFSLAWDDAKQREGLIDFNDQIRRAADLLTQSDYAQWISYKLDRQFDHILVDEAQDTNAAQWQIIDALTAEFFAGAGQRGDRLRTLFVVGDEKQAIFRFQGTSPDNFRKARERVRDAMMGAAENVAGTRGAKPARQLQDLDLGRSFRTTQPVLDFVDQAIASIGHEQFGLSRAPDHHHGDDMPGQVTLWPPVQAGKVAAESDDDTQNVAPEDYADDGDLSGEAQDDTSGGGQGGTWLSKPERQMADRVARQVRTWMDEGFPLIKGGARMAGPGDVMVLVRSRTELAGLIVARLHAAGVPVAGVDRLRLGAPLAVRDLMAALRFAAQPLDCLNLACLLVSPLIGWSQEQLLCHGYREAKVPLWNHLRRSSDPEVAAVLDRLGQLLARADYIAPQALLHWVLLGPWQGRVALVARLGHQANDPIDELLNAAHVYAQTATPSLAGFLQWFDTGDGEIKREADLAGNQVRVLTVHGAKGLQAPIVILADATKLPDKNRNVTIDLADPAQSEWQIPLPPLRSAERVGRVGDAHQQVVSAELEEYRRLLYVAMTRAEEALFVGGALGLNAKEPPADSWYAALRAVFGTAEPVDDVIWGRRWVWGQPVTVPQKTPAAASEPVEPAIAVPAWLSRPAPEEPRPPRPLAPSSLGEDLTAALPAPQPDQQQAMRRGSLIHKLLERLPAMPPEGRRSAALRWLERHGQGFTVAEHETMLDAVLTVMDEPAWADLFAADALPEVSIAATVGGQVIAGTIDRLTVSPDQVRFVDFKTGRHVPGDASQVPVSILRQMGAYAAALATTFPDRVIKGAVLYTAGPVLIELPEEILAMRV